MKLRNIFLLGMLVFSMGISAENKKVGVVNVTPDSSLVDALRKAREMRRLGQADSVVIKMARGNYRLYEPLVIRPEDSHLCFEGSYGGTNGGNNGNVGNATICGAIPIMGWRKQGKLWVADVPDFNGRPLEFRHLWVNRQRAEKARSVSDYEKMPRIRWVDKKKRIIWVPASAVRPLLSGAKDKQGNSILRADSRYAEMTLHQMWEVSYLRIKSVRMQGDSAAVSFHDPEAKIQFERPWPSPMYNSEHNSPFFISNALPLLDKPGEWYHDFRNGKLYYMPRKGEALPAERVSGENGSQASGAQIYVAAPALETLVRFEGTPERMVDAVTFKNVNFGFTSWLRPSCKGHVPLQAGMYITEGYKLRPSIDRKNNHKLDNQDWLGRPSAAVELRYARRAVFDGCGFEHLGGDGLDYVEGCRDGGVLNCQFSDIAMNGLVCGSFSPAALETHLPYQPEDRREVCSGLQVKNSEFSDVTHEEWGTCAIALGYVSRMNIEHNYIHDVSYSAISMGWGWNRDISVMHSNRIHANLIECYAAHMYDCAGIYTLGNQPNTVIYENVVRDILHPSYVHDPKHYFYLYTDEGSSNILLKDNWTSEDKFLKNAYGPNNVWTNNGPQVSEDIVKKAGLLQNGERAAYDAAIPALPKE